MSTAVIVVLSVCVCLYAGIEDSLKNQFPKEVSVSIPDGSEQTAAEAVRFI